MMSISKKLLKHFFWLNSDVFDNLKEERFDESKVEFVLVHFCVKSYQNVCFQLSKPKKTSLDSDHFLGFSRSFIRCNFLGPT